ncbi:hypothetical protein A3I36_00245 [Candidatus Giovannonibacteria bacterium RIFCSPLOWO2_02_FULL_45_28]|uniref:Uncharacterized protein n=2 Tax=Candidatus Giovannoniibacteriota TaxID=1752738 RepID=A0A1F5WAR4_9BACT|nr:MAG: hypothetical protein UW15_C0019G0008 [Parcubacteria group bacterium GW2011_GWC1_44_10]KKT59261.1 MAG: hypothetical protein UW53_C0017G0008 [Candidatus Giovannonibacteria bacterium GW2011_GWA1_44_25]KKU29559.1 MAG: hypothetical protein UX43_C0009G0011 [Candidatus Giovannonibacteria bacterium GW2011_GWB1_46_20]OGF49237.1 MAG: hypothetical protein A2120_04145 [Candidatus Giovannonibacteria bacterium GWA2_45_15]OGF59525.1 MAG: hypothetical protein A2W40_02770 [Candidatus Giovannonibacteria 
MFKKILVLAAVFSLFFVVSAVATEAEEKELTPRQLLLQQIPEVYALDHGNGGVWGVVHNTPFGSLEYISRTTRITPEKSVMQVIYMLGGKIKAVSLYEIKPGETPTPLLVIQENPAGKMDIYNTPSAEFEVEVTDVDKFIMAAREKAISIMKLLKVFEDKDLNELVKRINIKEKRTDPKKATSL